MGKYCLHFHHAGQCADCVFMGNAIYECHGSRALTWALGVFGSHASTFECDLGSRSLSLGLLLASKKKAVQLVFSSRSAQVGITVHGTHRSLVDNNVLWDTGAAGRVWAPCHCWDLITCKRSGRGGPCEGIYIEDGNEMFNTLSSLVEIIG